MTNESKIRECPYCREEIRVGAIKCKHCGSSITPEKPSHEGTCPHCKEQIHPEATRCKHCKSHFIGGDLQTVHPYTWINEPSNSPRFGGSISPVNLPLLLRPRFGFGRFGLFGDPIPGTGKVVHCYTTCENGTLTCHCHTDQGYWYSYDCGSCL